MPDARDLSKRIETSYLQRLAAVPEDARRLLLVAAAEPLGDPLLLQRAGERLGIALAAVDATDGLLAIEERVTFRHPLARSAVYWSADAPERRAAHLALSEVTDRRGRSGPSCVASGRRRGRARRGGRPRAGALGESGAGARRLRGRGGVPAACGRADRRLRTACRQGARCRRCKPGGGVLRRGARAPGGGADGPARRARSSPRGRPAGRDRVRRESRRRRSAAAARSRAEARAARRPPRAPDVPGGVGRGAVRGRAGHGGQPARRLPRRGDRAPSAGRPGSVRCAPGRPLAARSRRDAPRRRRCCSARSRLRPLRSLRRGDAPVGMAGDAGGERAVGPRQQPRRSAARTVQLARDSGALEALAVAGNAYGQAAAFAGDFATVASLVAEVEAVREATGTRIAPTRRNRAHRPPRPGGRGLGAARRRHRGGGDGRPGDRRPVRALGGVGAHERPRPLRGGARVRGARRATTTPELYIASWALGEVIEAATRTENTELARDALARLGDRTRRRTRTGRSGSTPAHGRC